MVRTAKLGLTRIILMSPQRRVELSVPEHLPLASLLPTFLRHGGAELADEGIAHHGWVLRRIDGTLLDPDRSLGAAGVLDGDVLVLAPQDQSWPEPAFDDISEAVGHEARHAGAAWAPRHTRAAGLFVTVGLLLCGLVLTLRAGPPWTVTGMTSALVGGVALAGAIVVARVTTDALVATVLSAAAYTYAVLGAVLLVTESPTMGVGALLAGGATLVVVGTVSLLGIGLRREVHVSVVATGLFGGAAAVLGVQTTAAAAAGCTATLLLLVSPWLPRIALHQAGMPAPTVPRPSSEESVDEPHPPQPEIAVLARRGDQLLTGLLWGAGVVLTGSAWVLASRADGSARVLAGAIVVICALRARAFAALRHRLPMLCAAGAGTVGFLVLVWESVEVPVRVATVAPVVSLLVLCAVAGVTAGRRFASRRASPQLGRLGDVLEFVLIATSAVLAAAVAGVFGYVRGLGG